MDKENKVKRFPRGKRFPRLLVQRFPRLKRHVRHKRCA